MMTTAEILEFLELPPKATDADIKRRATEKKTFFEKLQQSAPNTILKNLHTKNLQKTIEILTALGANANAANDDFVAYSGSGSHQKKEAGAAKSKTGAVLVRHTENMPTKSFPLQEGKNILGRERNPQYSSIIIDNDAYVSRQHALIDFSTYPTAQLFITDGVGKPSKNGTYINGNDTPIAQKIKLHNNDTIQIGMTKFVVKLSETVDVSQMEYEVEESEYMKTVIINI